MHLGMICLYARGLTMCSQGFDECAGVPELVLCNSLVCK